MAKDYFQDIVPPAQSVRRPQPKVPAPVPPEAEAVHVPIHREAPIESLADTDRSIRNVSIQRITPRRAAEVRDVGQLGASRRPGSRWWLWAAAFLALLIVGALALVALRPTSVSIVPRTHTLSFSGEQFTAVPATDSTIGLVYTVETIELEDSEVVASEGTVYAEDKASGTITIYNDYQSTPLRLIRNTRFATPDGRVFRAPAEVVVPAKKGTTPGKIDITVVADQAGEEYNVPAGKFTLPGLQSTPEMYSKVYAESASAFTGGFKGERPGVATGALESAIATVRARLEAKARSSIASNDEKILFDELAVIEYENLPNTTEAGGGVRIHQKARVQVPVFSASNFIAEVARTAVGDGAASIRLMAADDFAAQPTSPTVLVGADNITFALSGRAELVWNVPETDIAAALAGKNQAAFESIIGTFTSVQEAKASVQPFWKDTFPENPEDIKIKVEEPATGQ